MTRKMILIASVASLALTSPVAAQKGERGNDKAPRAEVQQSGGQQAQRPQKQERQQQAERPQRQERQQAQRAERPQKQERQQQAERPQRQERQERQVHRAERPQRVERQNQRAERQERRTDRPQQVERQQRAERPQRIERNERVDRKDNRIERQQRAERPQRIDNRIERNQRPQQVERQLQRGDRRLAEQMFAPRRADKDNNIRTARFDGRGYRPVAPLFSTRDMRQMKPFKAKFDDRRIVSIGDRFDTNRNWSSVPAFYGSRYVDTPDYYYRYDNDYGYAYQVNRRSNIVSSLYPLFGGYGIGDPWPQTYYSSYVPSGYRDYYYDTPDYYYRNDGYGIYQVDSSSQLITALVSLVMGQGYGIGQSLPASYGVYNVPLDYRASYQDDDDNYYRYGDGYIYQVDQGSRRIAARYPIYGDDYDIGERWPVAYPDYNIPYGYQSAYADSPQYQYRYANDGIYQVDPTNQVILALAALISGDQFAVGQRMPSGYDTYNVPLDYRDRYADSGNDYYRYANGNVYRVDTGSGLIEDAYPVYG